MRSDSRIEDKPGYLPPAARVPEAEPASPRAAFDSPSRLPLSATPLLRRGPTGALALAIATLATAASGAYAPPWVVKGDVPLPSWVRSARVLRADEPVFATPSKTGKKRGAAAREARLPVFGARSGAGCEGRWINVGPSAWICDGALELSGNDPVRAGVHTFADPKDGLPFRYHFVGSDGSSAYRRLDAVDIGEPEMQLEPGFAVAVIEEKTFDGALYARTSHNLWVPMRDLGPARPTAFQGEMLAPPPPAAAPNSPSPANTTSSANSPSPATTARPVPPIPGPMPFAWVLPDKARLLQSPAGVYTSQSKARFEVVPILETHSSGRYLRVGPSSWIASKDVRRPTVTDPPPEVTPSTGERWIDVDLATQTLVAYEGKQPVFATLVATGKGRSGTPTATPTGTFRLWIKLLATDMDNLEDENANRYYRMESVPYVQFFSKGYGLHGAYWHRGFGNVRSHGCVNLSPLDSQRLFWWTGPHLPAGWTAVFPTAHEAGTVIRVR